MKPGMAEYMVGGKYGELIGSPSAGYHAFCKPTLGIAALSLDRLPMTVGRYWLGDGSNQAGGGIKAVSF
jgi:hypothetical protein